MTDIEKLKPRLREYIQAIGLHTKEDGGILRVRCPDPGHTDNDPTAVVYDESVFCPVCSKTWDVVDVEQSVSGSDFKTALAKVQSTLGITSDAAAHPRPKKKKRTVGSPVPLTVEQAREIYTTTALLEHSKYRGKGDAKQGYGDEITGAWPFKNAAGEVVITDVRFEGGPRQKNVVSFYWDGKHLKSSGCPVMIYGLDLLNQFPEHKVVIVEGCKAAKAGEVLIDHGLICITWNGGTNKVSMPDWSILEGRDVYIIGDDDAPGQKAAQTLSELTGGIIVPPHPDARAIKDKGADLVEVLAVLEDTGAVANYITSHEHTAPPKETDHDKGHDAKTPFKILGVAENGRAYYLDRAGRLYDIKLDRLGKSQLMCLAPLTYWQSWAGVSKMSAEAWTTIQDDMIQVTGEIDFELDNVRGRGAWRESNGDLCYHDGVNTVGDYGPDRVFLRKPKQNIGISSKDLPRETVDAMKDAVMGLAFETKSDAMRLLAWSTLAPFAGALTWRPQAFLTGPSGAGKSSIESLIVKSIAIPSRYNGGKTSAAGFIQDRKQDAGAVVIEEADADTDKKRTYKEDLLSIMRQSTSDDTPKSAMGTSDQAGTSFMTRDMFLFVAISPEIESLADDNRLVMINIAKPKKDGRQWSDIKRDIQKLINRENSARLRGMTWRRLPGIISLSDRIAAIIQDHTGKDHRFAISEGTLMAAYMVIWKGIDVPADEQIREFVEANYDMYQPSEGRDEVQEIIETILEHKVRVVYQSTNREFSVMEAMSVYHHGEITIGEGPNSTRKPEAVELMEFKRGLNYAGVHVTKEAELCIAIDHGELKRILGRSSGYNRVLWRSKDLIEKNRPVKFIDKVRRCVVIGGVMIDAEIPF